MFGDESRSGGGRAPAIAQRFRDMHPADTLDTRQIRDGPGDAQHPGVAACGHARRFGCLSEQAAAGLVRRGDRVEQRAVRFRIGTRRLSGIARGLNRAGGGDPCGDLGRSFLGRRQDEVGGTDRGDFDMQVDAVA